MSSATLDRASDAPMFDLHGVDDDHRRDPYPAYKRLRDEAPLSRNRDGSFVVTRYADVSKVLNSSVTSADKGAEFRRAIGMGPILEYHLSNMTAFDPPRHGRVRGAIATAFTPRAMQRWTPMVEEAVEELLDQAEARGVIDFVNDFAAVLPLTLICRMLGVKVAEKERFRLWANSITSSLDPGASAGIKTAANGHAEEWKAFFAGLIAERRAAPKDDLISMLLHLEAGEEPVSDLTLLHNLALLLSAGHETTTALLASAVDLLFQNPGETARLRDQPALWESAVEEFLRIESPVQMGVRRATAPIEVSGGVVPTDALVWTIQGAANRDERQFADPDRLDIGRRPNRHLAFAFGIHACLGAPLARLEARVALRRLHERFPKLTPASPPTRYLRTRYRGFSEYPLRVS